MPARLDRSSVAGVERLNGIRRTDDAADLHVVPFAVGVSWRTPDTYHTVGLERGTASSTSTPPGKTPGRRSHRLSLLSMAAVPCPALSVVAPCCDEEEVLPEFLRRVGAVLDAQGGRTEIVVVDDGSHDRTWEIMEKAAAEDPRVVAVRLMRNHGQQLALTAGLSLCTGERILIIDADLQDPPELLPDMMALMDQGADVVYGQRRRREGESIYRRFSAGVFYRLISRMTDVDIPTETGDFRLITRRVLDTLIAMPERHRFVRGMVAWIGGKQVPLVYDRDPRGAGRSKYPFLKLLLIAVDAITAFSVVPLRLSLMLGWVMAGIGFALAIYSSAGALLGQSVPGWSSLMAALCLLSGVQFFMLGVIGAYLGRLYDQSKGRPLFMIRDMVRGCDGLVPPEKPGESCAGSGGIRPDYISGQ